MKSFVLSALICVVAGSSFAHETNNVPKETADVKELIAFHCRNVDVLWEQYGIAETRIKTGSGSHAELDRDKQFFIDVYQRDIDQGIRIEASQKAIADIKANYAKKHAKRDKEEKVQLTKLQQQLCVELKNEEKRFEKMKRKYANVINEELSVILDDANQHFANAIRRANNFHTSTTIASR